MLRDVCPVHCRLVTNVSNNGPLARYITIISGGKSHPSLRTPDLDQSFLFYLCFYCIPLILMINLSSSRSSYILSLLFSFYKLDVSSKTLRWSSSCYLPSVVRKCCVVCICALHESAWLSHSSDAELGQWICVGAVWSLTVELLSVLHLVTRPLMVSA